MVDAAADFFARDKAKIGVGAGGRFLHDFISDPSVLPPLARWDAIWYYGIASGGYRDDKPDSRFKVAFLPLYPWVAQVVRSIFGGNWFISAIWVSRISLLLLLMAMAFYVRTFSPCGHRPEGAVLALLAYPSAFVLVSAYAESLFLLFVICTFLLLRLEREYLCAGAAALACCTRGQGLALFAPLALAGYAGWRRGRPVRRSVAPPAAVLLAYGALIAWCSFVFDEPFRHMAVRRELWGQRLTWPWTSVGRSLASAERALSEQNLGSIYVCLQLPSLYLAIAALGVSCARRQWPEAAYVAGLVLMSLLAGSLSGFPRYALVAFPAFIALWALQRWPVAWYFYLVSAFGIQLCVLAHYVRFVPPAP